MNPREQLKKARERARALKALDRDLTDDELAEVDTLVKEIPELEAKVARMDAASKSLKSLSDGDDTDDEPDDDDDDDEPAGGSKAGGAKATPRSEKLFKGTFGDRFIKSERYKEFQKAFPSGPGHGSPIDIGRVKVGTMGEWFTSRKAIGSDIAQLAPIRFPTIDLVERNRLTLLDLISRGQTQGNFEYVQVTDVTRNAAIVAEATDDTGTTPATGLKPVSDMATQLEDAKVYTYADGYDVTNSLLADAPAFATYMNAELQYSLESVIEDKLLNGTGTSGEPKGILHTTGVQEQTYTSVSADPFEQDSAMAFVKAVRRAITKVVRLQGGTVSAIVLSPEMDEAIDLLQDANERFYGQGPFGSGPQTLWGRPRITSERLVGTEALLGDFRQVALLDREGLSVLAFNQHKDYAQRNMVYVRAELRAAQAIWRPNRLVVVKPATP
ncbi:phage major capsid protein [Rhodococcus pyridinivorans]|uniref:Phage major capsid protein n=1 Tax=Rhodococcus pyridinivorans TaxID=103816 RepID=A0A7M2XNQ8_9NOCA|nr:phage major capsid protein [Rhodococcus pyridinivorans]QOV99516.1 phage major capsid protein [Rhodococcus pyridinivorans]